MKEPKFHALLSFNDLLEYEISNSLLEALLAPLGSDFIDAWLIKHLVKKTQKKHARYRSYLIFKSEHAEL